ncbi:MAG: ABC transporter permease subunit, partial [Candidatus Korarchaeota archaeon]|nr:ABC transporter permease subunit [Candidatus Korarchaeota archaeon]
MGGKLWVLLWKELLDLARDRKTLVATVLLPLVSMPLLALTTSYFSGQQEAIVYLVDQDGGSGCIGTYCVDSSMLAARMAELVESYAPRDTRVSVRVTRERPSSGYDVMVVLLRGFTANLTSLERVALVEIAKNIGSSKAEQLYGTCLSALATVSDEYSRLKVEYLANASGLSVDPEAVLHPVKQLQVLVTPGGAPAGQRDEFRVWSARFLAFALAFIVMPPTVFITDSIAGERERKTLETLLVAPISRRLVLTAKLVA